MGDYNPDAPVIGGNEFVGIRNELVSFSLTENTREVGTTFTLPTARQLGFARFYIDHMPQSVVTNQPVMISIYPTGQEGRSGPIQSCIIPVVSGAVTGATLSGAATVQDAVFSAANAGRIAFTANASVLQANVHFNTTAYAQTLVNKRILQVNVLYGMYGDVQLAVDSGSPLALNVRDASSTVPYTQSLDGDSANAQSTLVRRVSLGEVNPYWNVPVNVLTISEQLPWTMQQLLHFDNAATNPYAVWFTRPASAVGTGQLNITYCALEVVYCEESRVAYGCGRFGSSRGSGPQVLDTPLVYGANTITLRAPISDNANPGIAAGTYTVVVNQPDGGDISGLKTQGSVIEINGLRMLYALPAHAGVQTDIPWPPFASLGQTFNTESTLVIPQTSIHLTGGGVIPEVQVYGRTVAGPVYGGVTISVSEFFDKSNLQSATTYYNQARFYVRRFGNTQQAIKFASGGLGGSASVTPAQFDALPEIVDGWKEVSVKFNVDTSGTAFIGISDSGGAGDAAGNRWEVLGVDAPALSGTAGNLFNNVPAAQLLDNATYLQPNGAASNMFWASPSASGAASGDTSADICFLISTTPPDVSTPSVSQQSQALTVTLDCGVPPQAIPTGMSYVQLSWVSLALTGSNFGYYEIQRSDTIDSTFTSIARISSQSTVSFKDYEARVGVATTYRMRIANAMGFFGNFVTVGPITLSAPGVVGRNVTNGVLMFTSNVGPTGNAAYTPSWDGNPVEDLTFTEASRVQLQWMYGKDFLNAFSPLERGGEQFTRTLLVANAAAAGPVLEQAFQGLRDFAWSQVPYICVRNELGDRWYANVQVPSGSYQRNRRTGLVQVTITEISNVPFQVQL